MNSKIDEIPLEDFFKNPEKSSYQISPNGKHIAYMKPWKTRMNVFVNNLDTNIEKRITSSIERSIYGYGWLDNNRIGYEKDNGGDENIHFYAVNIDGTDEVDLTPFENIQARLVDELDSDPKNILISLNKLNPQLHDVYKVNINSGDISLVAKNPGNISSWMTDHDGKLRVASTADGVSTSLLFRDKEEDDFKIILTTNFKEEVSPLFFTFDNKNIYVSSNRGRDKSAIFLFNMETKKEDTLIFEHPKVDVSGLMYSKKRKVITGVSYNTDKQHIEFFDIEREQIQRKLEAHLPEKEIAISSLTKNEKKAIVVSYSDRTKGTYYYYDIENNTLQELAQISPWIIESKMARMEPISYKSRDGLEINGYLTLPLNKKSKNLPVVINPHGGPWARDSWGYNPEVQFLANRGYAVLQMNFRGSTGFGRSFWEASFKQWGKSMQNDISDGVKWLIDKEIANPEKIAIYGASYGGYAVLAGLAFTPKLYACGIDYVGVSNIFTLLDTLPPYWELGRQMMYEMIGDPQKDKELLKEASPFFHADKIEVPLFVAQGSNDPRVKKSESDQIVNALKKRSIDVPYMVKENEGHGFQNEENRFEFYNAMEKFLGEYMLIDGNND